MTRRFALIPAAGVGARSGADLPKQYVPIDGVPMLVHTLRAFLDTPAIDLVCVVFAPGDAWPDSDRAHTLRQAARGRLAFAAVGGASRAASVANGLAWLGERGEATDWVLVHDAARPCIARPLIERLIDALGDDPVGGLLALPVADTVKRGDAAGRVAATVPREGLWLAQTPQMFRIATLRRAYALSPEVTDEAAAVEATGLAPRLIAGDAANFKVTYPEDFARAASILASRGP